MSDTSSIASSASGLNRQGAYSQLVNILTSRGLPFGEVVEPLDKKRNTKWTAAITVNGKTYRSDAFTQGKMEALNLAADRVMKGERL